MFEANTICFNLVVNAKRLLTSFDPQNEYAQILAKRVAESRETKTEARKRRASSMKK